MRLSLLTLLTLSCAAFDMPADTTVTAQATEDTADSVLQRIEAVDAHFYQEETDAWAEEMESIFRIALEDPRLGGTTIQSLECRSTMCRLVLNHQQGGSYAQTVTNLRFVIQELLDDECVGQGYSAPLDHERNRSIHYQARCGYGLPRSGHTPPTDAPDSPD